MTLFDYSEAQAAQRLGVSSRTLRRWRQDPRKKIPHTETPGGRIGYTEAQLNEIIYHSRYRKVNDPDIYSKS